MPMFILLQRLRRNREGRAQAGKNMRKASVLNFVKDGEIKLKDG